MVSIDGMIAAVAGALEGMDEQTQVIPGHGPLSDKAGLQRYHEMLSGARGGSQGAAEGGKGGGRNSGLEPSGTLERHLGARVCFTREFWRRNNRKPYSV